MIVVANRIPVAKGYEKAFEERFGKRLRLVESAPGFLRNEILRPIRGDHYVVLVYWETREAFEAWSQSDAFRQAHAEHPPAQMFSGPNVLEIYEVIMGSEVPS